MPCLQAAGWRSQGQEAASTSPGTAPLHGAGHAAPLAAHGAAPHVASINLDQRGPDIRTAVPGGNFNRYGNAQKETSEIWHAGLHK